MTLFLTLNIFTHCSSVSVVNFAQVNAGSVWTGAGSGLLISMLEKPNWFSLTGLITLVLLMCLFLDGSVLEGKPSFKMLGLTFSSKFDWDSSIISIAKISSKKIGTLIHSVKFLSPELAKYL